MIPVCGHRYIYGVYVGVGLILAAKLTAAGICFVLGKVCHCIRKFRICVGSMCVCVCMGVCVCVCAREREREREREMHSPNHHLHSNNTQERAWTDLCLSFLQFMFADWVNSMLQQNQTFKTLKSKSGTSGFMLVLGLRLSPGD